MAFVGSNKIYQISNFLCIFFSTGGTTAKQKDPKEAWANALDSGATV